MIILKKILYIAFCISLTLTSCSFEQEESYNIDFYVKNNCNEQIKVNYTIRRMSQINGLTFEDYSQTINIGQSIELYVLDNIKADGNIKGVFFEFDIYKGDDISEYDFWETEFLQKSMLDDRIEFILSVDSTFFE